MGKISKHQYKNQIADRGLIDESIANTINNPYNTGIATNKYTGNSVTLCYCVVIHYVAVCWLIEEKVENGFNKIGVLKLIVKKEGAINQIIYENTVYHNGDYRIYLTTSDLINLIQEIIQSKSTTSYIRFTPFYSNAKLDQEIEFDEYMFYMECRDQIDRESLEKHLGACFGKEYVDMDDEEIRFGKILFPLCKNDDIEAYQKLLEVYVEFLNELIPKLMELAKIKMNLKHTDLAFGYFCFEVNSG